MVDHLCDECKAHFKEVLEFLDEIELPYRLNPYLVRGLDYYTKTVFEIFEDSNLLSTLPAEGRAPGETGRGQGALVAGGRYDGLVKLLGGRDTPASGGAGGIERIINLIKTRQVRFKKEKTPEIFLAQLGTLAKRKSLRLLEDFRKAKIQVAESFGRDSLNAQMTRADKIGASHTLILGQREALEGTIIVRDMASGRQETVKIDRVVNEMTKKLKSR